MSPFASTLLVFSLIATFAVADVPITREEAGSIKGYRIEELNKAIGSLEGKLVRLKLMGREGEIKRAADGGLSGILIERLSNPDGSFQRVPGSVASDGADWFMRLPVGYPERGGRVFYAIGRVEFRDGRPNVQILGREIKTDLKGSRVVW